jgi:hypothetical protein
MLALNVDRPMDIIRDIAKVGDDYKDSDCTLVVQNDGAPDLLGVMVDVYDGDDCIDSYTFWFEDYND